MERMKDRRVSELAARRCRALAQRGDRQTRERTKHQDRPTRPLSRLPIASLRAADGGGQLGVTRTLPASMNFMV